MPFRVMVVGISFCVIARFVTGLACAQPSGEEILKKVIANFDGIDDYTVSLDVKIDIERLKVPPMTVTLYFKQPDKMHFESKSFAMLPRDGVALNPRRLLKGFSVSSVEESSSHDGVIYKLSMGPKDDRPNLRQMFVFVDARRFTIDSIASSLGDRRTMTAGFTHSFESGHWLPAHVVVRFSAPLRDTTSDESTMDAPPPITRPTMPRSGTITVRYFDYRVNTGLRDEVFEKKNGVN